MLQVWVWTYDDEGVHLRVVAPVLLGGSLTV